jgi:glycosyltransferase involved in cell wall biosynthesis
LAADQPFVSVVITTLNRLDYLRRALASVEGQAYRNFDILVMDDGSSDGTVEFLEGYQSSAPFRWQSVPSCERANLRNRGAALASGNLLSFLDDDDEWHEEKLVRQVECMQANPDAVASYCFTVPIGPDGSVLHDLAAEHRRLYLRQVRDGHGFESLARHCLIFTSGVMVRRAAFEHVGGYQDRLIPAEDWHYYLCLAKAGRIVAVADPLVRYRVHEANHATGAETGKLTKLAAARITAAQDLLSAMARDRDDARARSALLQFIGQNYYVAGDIRTALSFASRSFRASPLSFSRPETVFWAVKVLLKTVASSARA